MSSLINPDEPNYHVAEIVSEVARPIAQDLCTALGIVEPQRQEIVFLVVAKGVVNVVADLLGLSYLLSKADERLRELMRLLAVLTPQEL